MVTRRITIPCVFFLSSLDSDSRNEDSDVNITTSCVLGKGADYRGTMNVTPEGVTCQRWDSQFPHNHSFLPHNFKCKWVMFHLCLVSGWIQFSWLSQGHYLGILTVEIPTSIKWNTDPKTAVISTIIWIVVCVYIVEIWERTTAVTPMVQITHGASLQTPTTG